MKMSSGKKAGFMITLQLSGRFESCAQSGEQESELETQKVIADRVIAGQSTSGKVQN